MEGFESSPIKLKEQEKIQEDLLQMKIISDKVVNMYVLCSILYVTTFFNNSDLFSIRSLILARRLARRLLTGGQTVMH